MRGALFLFPFSFYLFTFTFLVSSMSPDRSVMLALSSGAASAVAAAVSGMSGWCLASAVACAVGEDEAGCAERKYEG